MKTLLKPIIVVSALGLMAFKAVEYVVETQTPVEVITKEEVILPEIKIEDPEIIVKIYDHQTFLHDLGNFESGNRYHIKNRFGYLGKYQFHISTLKSLGIKTTKIEFLSNPDLQEEAMDRLLTSNYRTLRRYIRKYDGKILHGVVVTKSGILAAAHLGGAGNVRNWFRKGENFADANGTKITKYMKIFAGYNLEELK